MSNHTTTTVRIWDLPTRIFHWTLASCVLLLILTGSVGGNAMVWHFRLGYLVFSLIIFRVLWGLVGGYWSRWLQLPLSPRKVWAYLHGRSEQHDLIGHNPLGSWSVLTMVLILGLQVSTGLVSDDEIANAGPLTSLVSETWVSLATFWHKAWGKWIIIALVIVHVMAVLWHQYRHRQALLQAMLHGDKILKFNPRSSLDTPATRFSALIIALASFVLVRWVIGLGG